MNPEIQEVEGIEIVFVSSDQSADDMASYMKVSWNIIELIKCCYIQKKDIQIYTTLYLVNGFLHRRHMAIGSLWNIILMLQKT